MAHLRLCASEYDKWSPKKEVHVCNLAVSRSAGQATVIDFPLDGLQEYLLENKVI